MAAPKWAADLLARVWAEQGQGAEMPTLAWRRMRDEQFTGGFFTATGPRTNRISISAGSDRADAQAALLHELGHALSHARGNPPAHDATFWDITFGLMRLYYTGPVQVMVDRQVRYRAGAIAGARRHGFRLGEKRAALLRRYGAR